MQLDPQALKSRGHLAQPLNRRPSPLLRAAGVVLLAGLVLVTGAAQSGQQNADKSLALPGAARLPDTAPPAPPAPPLSPERQQLADESDQLLTLAISLKAEVDKTNKDVLSMNVIRKADEIEKMAHTLREHMRTAPAK